MCTHLYVNTHIYTYISTHICSSIYMYIHIYIYIHTCTCVCVYISIYTYSDSSERWALMNTSEEMGQARDTSTQVTLNALNSTNSPRILDSLLCCSMDAREEKRIFKCSVRNKTSKLNFLVRDKISSVGAQAKVTPVAHGGRSCS